MDPDVRRIVLGPAVSTVKITAAVLHNWQCVRLKGRGYPVIVEAPGATTEGCLADKIDIPTSQRLLAFEGAEYREVRLEVNPVGGAPVEARVFTGNSYAVPETVPWSYENWCRLQKAAFSFLLNSEIEVIDRLGRCLNLRATPGR